jgi:hypothetical protein
MNIMPISFMPWIDKLPEVGDKITHERNRLAERLAIAEKLEKEAAVIRAEVKTDRAALVGKVAEYWSLGEIERAANAATQSGPVPLACVEDEYLRSVLIGLDGGASALDLLRAFREACVVRQHNLTSTATAQEQRATIQRVLDWWNFGVYPLLLRLNQ